MRSSLGIELRKDVAILTCLKRELQGFRWVAGKIAPLAPDGQGDLRQRESNLVQAIREFLFQHGVRPQQIVLGLPRSEVLLRFLDLPQVPREDLEQMLPYELERHLPFPVGEARFDFQILNKGDDGRQKVLLIAVKRAIVEHLIDLLDLAGLRPDVVDVTCLATCNALTYRRKLSPEESWAVVDLHDDELEVSAFREGTLGYSRSIGLLEPSGWVEQMRQEWKILRHHVSSPDAQPDRPPVSRVLVAGMASNETLCGDLQDALGVPVSVAPVPAGIAGPAALQAPISSFVTALGLALRGLAPLPLELNLWPSEREKKKAEPPNLWIPAGLLAVILFLLAGWLAVQHHQDKQHLASLNEEIVSYEPRILAVENTEKELKRYREQIETFRKLTRAGYGQLDTLKELTLLVPDNVWLTDYLFLQKRDKVSIGGKADSASSLVSPLEASPLFKNVRFSSSITKLGDKEQFKLELELEDKKLDERHGKGTDVSATGGGGRRSDLPVPPGRSVEKKPGPDQRRERAKRAPAG